MKIVQPTATLTQITSDAEKHIERCGRVCYKSEDRIEDDSAGQFIRRLLELGHESVIEHAVATVVFVCGRGVTHELVRHRLASFSQESTRYCNYDKAKFGREISVIRPPELNEIAGEVWSRTCQTAECAYFELLDNGAPPQIARSVLPTCLKTEIAVTANLREWRHILKLRTSTPAHPQIRELMVEAGRQLKEAAPNVFHDFKFGNGD